MGTPTLSLQTIAERISESILLEKYISKEVIIEKVKLNLKIWHKLTNRPVDYDKIKTDTGRQQYTIERKDIELEFWRGKMKAMKTEEEMKLLYSEQREMLSEMGYLEINKK